MITPAGKARRRRPTAPGVDDSNAGAEEDDRDGEGDTDFLENGSGMRLVNPKKRRKEKEGTEDGGKGAASPAPPPAPPSPQGHAFLCVRPRRGVFVGRRDGGPSTPGPVWRLLDQLHGSGVGGGGAEPGGGDKGSNLGRPSARKLATGIWELHRRDPARMSRRRRREKAVLGEDRLLGHPASNSPPTDQPASASSLRRHVAVSLMQHHRAAQKNGRALQSVSPASYGSSMEITAYNPPLTPSSSLDFKGQFAEIGYSLKTSTELLKVLNRIWSLEEQHASNVELVRALNMELDHARGHIQEMMQKHQADRKEIDELVKKLMKVKLNKRTKEEEKIKVVVQSLKDDLHEEMKLRIHSDGLHRKLTKELFEVNASFSNALKELEKERKGRVLLEQLCDEFAKALGVYEQEIRAMKHKYEKDYTGIKDDKLILHIAEAWLDEREQIKQAEAGIEVDKEASLDKFKRVIMEFLKTKHSTALENEGPNAKDSKVGGSLRLFSVESIHLNGAVSAPQDAGDEDSLVSNFSYLNLNNAYEGKEDIGHISHGELENGAGDSEMARTKRMGSRPKIKDRSLHQLKIIEHMDIGRFKSSCDPADTMASAEERISREAIEAGDGKRNKLDTTPGWTHETGEMTRSNRPFSRELIGHPEDDHKEDGDGFLSRQGHSTMASGDGFAGAGFGIPSPVQKGKLRQASPDIIESYECASKGLKEMKEGTLKAKLLEARLEGQKARLRGSKIK